MPQVVAKEWVPVTPETAFAVSQTTGEVRLRWDPFIRHQHLVDADRPAKGVQTVTRARVGPSMLSEYVSYRPPTSVGMTMIRGPWFFAAFGAGWRFVPESRGGHGGTRAVWKYTYAVRPAWLRPVAEPIGQWLLGREICARIAAFARACEDPEVLRTLSPALGLTSPPTDIEFRRAAVDTGDGGRLAQEMAAEIAELYDGLDHNGPLMPAAGPAQLGPPTGGFWVGYDGSDAVCCGGIKQLSDSICEIKKMYVVRAARGHGVARRMLTHLDDEARALGYAVVRLDTGPRQPGAQHLYESAGYVVIDNFNNHPLATYFGEKQL